MTSWEQSIGTFEYCKAPAVERNMAQCFLAYAMHQAEEISTQYREKRDNFEDPYNDRYTLEQYLNPPPTGKKHMYKGTIKEKVMVEKNGKSVPKTDKDGKIVYKEKTGSFPAKSFGVVKGETKTFMVGLLNWYLNEAQKCYKKNKKVFANKDGVLGQLTKYCSENYLAGESIATLVIHTCSLMNADGIIDDESVSSDKIPVLTDYLLGKAGSYFKNDKGKIPTRELEVIIGAFVQFLKVVAIQLMAGKWGENLGNITVSDFTGTVRQICNVLHAQDVEYPYDVFAEIFKWSEDIESRAAAKKRASSKSPSRTKGKAVTKSSTKKSSSTKSSAKVTKKTSSSSSKPVTKKASAKKPSSSKPVTKKTSKVNSKKVEEELEALDDSDADSEENDGSEEPESVDSEGSSVDDTAPSDQEVEFE